MYPMPLLNFKRQFAPEIKSGEKRSTIRPLRKRPIREGDILYLYVGLRSRNAERLGVEVCTEAERLTITENRDVVLGCRYLTEGEKETLAWQDGFRRGPFAAMIRFIEREYGLPFFGQIIKW